MSEPLITFTVPGAAQPKERPRFGSGRTYTNKKTRTYEGAVRNAALTALYFAGDAPAVLLTKGTPVKIELLFIMPRPKRTSSKHGRLPHCRRPDIDNLTKAVLDGLPKSLLHDDGQICTLHASAFYAAADEDPHTTVKIWRIR